MSAAPGRRVAIVHDWLTGRRGGERVLEAMLGLLPQAELYVLVHQPGRVPEVELGRRIRQSWVGALRLPGRGFQLLFPLFNEAMGALRLEGYDLVVSISHCAAKNVRPPPGTPHLCYCLTPARYAWELFDDYLTGSFGPRLAGWLRGPARVLRDRWRRLDRRRSRGVTRFVAISELVRGRIARIYNRPAGLVYPPVEVEAFGEAFTEASAGASASEARFVMVSALRPNKRVAESVEACRRLDLPLDVIGEGSARVRRALERGAGPRTRILGELSDGELRRRVAGCRALLHPAREDFGIAPVEAMAAGRPVIGARDSGVAETVIDGVTGLLLEDPSAAGIAAGLERFIELEPRLAAAACRARAQDFSRARFEAGMRAELAALLGG